MRHGPPISVSVRLFVGPTLSWEIRTPWGPGNPISDHQSVHIGAKFLCNQYPPAIPCHPLPFLPVSTITSRALDGFGAFHVLLRPDLGLIHNAKVTTCLVHFHCKKYLSVSPVKLDQIGVSKDDSSIFVTTLGEMTINPWDLHGSPRCPDRLQRLQRLSLCIMKDGTKQQIVSLKSWCFRDLAVFLEENES